MEIFLLEDDAAIRESLGYLLESEGFAVTSAASCAAARESLEKPFDLYLLDIGLPDGSGWDVCKEVKARFDRPVIFLTASDEELNVVRGLEMGADDYIPKPFRVRELTARIKTVLRRAGRESTLSAGGVTVYPERAKVYKGNDEVLLTATEYRMLLILFENRGRVLTRTALLEKLYDIDGAFVSDNTLTVCVKRLRDKLEDEPTKPRLIHTVRGIGYVLDER